ncbi:hypothetical protein [Brevibacterium oceani]|uniref:hypothetical protein n=1 Tax=Brevibacterium oceani TaxID=358099 RepID=UPI0015E686CC|nr:hypothetical protein [Brevibacterium oceani]
MADPTPEELQQQIDELKELITTTYEPPSGSEFSYPVVNQPMNDEMWQYVTLGLGDGVLDEGGQPYWLRGRENENDTVKITVSTTRNTAQALLRGFYHRLTEDKTFTVQAVSTTTTYHFCLTYDPAATTTSGGPISLQMYAGEPPTTMGRFHIVLWKLTRTPSQLLTSATVERVRPKITPVITVDTSDHMPSANNVLWGTRCLVDDIKAEYRAGGASEDGPRAWLPVSSVYERPDADLYEWAGTGSRPSATRQGQIVVLEGRIARTGGNDFYASTSDGYYVATLPEEYRPAYEHRFLTKAPNYNNSNTATVNIGSDGAVRVYPNVNCSWVSWDGICYTVGS